MTENKGFFYMELGAGGGRRGRGGGGRRRSIGGQGLERERDIETGIGFKA